MDGSAASRQAYERVIAEWLDRGKPEAWGFFTNNVKDPLDHPRREYHRAFFDPASERLDFLAEPRSLSVLQE